MDCSICKNDNLLNAHACQCAPKMSSQMDLQISTWNWLWEHKLAAVGKFFKTCIHRQNKNVWVFFYLKLSKAVMEWSTLWFCRGENTSVFFCMTTCNCWKIPLVNYLKNSWNPKTVGAASIPFVATVFQKFSHDMWCAFYFSLLSMCHRITELLIK